MNRRYALKAAAATLSAIPLVLGTKVPVIAAIGTRTRQELLKIFIEALIEHGIVKYLEQKRLDTSERENA